MNRNPYKMPVGTVVKLQMTQADQEAGIMGEQYRKTGEYEWQRECQGWECYWVDDLETYTNLDVQYVINVAGSVEVSL